MNVTRAVFVVVASTVTTSLSSPTDCWLVTPHVAVTSRLPSCIDTTIGYSGDVHVRDGNDRVWSLVHPHHAVCYVDANSSVHCVVDKPWRTTVRHVCDGAVAINSSAGVRASECRVVYDAMESMYDVCLLVLLLLVFVALGTLIELVRWWMETSPTLARYSVIRNCAATLGASLASTRRRWNRRRRHRVRANRDVTV